ncbi:uncharacterized protein LOC116123023 [Pistacia vera]|uniref:uncharacterized protein LOC116123023 n=1 Tax=Pistacia vera TaxID=55513 RepID=UPI001263845F|nr:uncharacterized protein LOC116123023 [Pistacia vera]
MANIRTLREFSVPIVDGSGPSITRPPAQANNFEIKPTIIQMIQQSVQFGGNANEDPNSHIANFLEICDTFKANRVLNDAIRLLPNVHTMVDVALQNKTSEATYELLEVLASNNYQRPNERIHSKKSMGVHEVDAYMANSA